VTRSDEGRRRAGKRRACATLGLFGFVASPALGADIAQGERIFQACAACHGAAGVGGESGPRLVGVIGRKAGSLDTFRYSPAMERAGFTWDETKLKAFVADPRSLVRGTRMPFDGLDKAQDVEDVVAYVASLK
jgi:cytochrome c